MYLHTVQKFKINNWIINEGTFLPVLCVWNLLIIILKMAKWLWKSRSSSDEQIKKQIFTMTRTKHSYRHWRVALGKRYVIISISVRLYVQANVAIRCIFRNDLFFTWLNDNTDLASIGSLCLSQQNENMQMLPSKSFLTI